jgi:hypothetical protein
MVVCNSMTDGEVAFISALGEGGKLRGGKYD